MESLHQFHDNIPRMRLLVLTSAKLTCCPRDLRKASVKLSHEPAVQMNISYDVEDSGKNKNLSTCGF